MRARIFSLLRSILEQNLSLSICRCRCWCCCFCCCSALCIYLYGFGILFCTHCGRLFLSTCCRKWEKQHIQWMQYGHVLCAAKETNAIREKRRVEKRSEYGQVKMNGVCCKFKYLWGLNSTSRESERKGAARGKSREIFCKSKKLFYSLHFKPRFLFEAAFDPLACLTCTSIPHKLTHCIALSQSRRQQEVYWSRPHNKCQECGTKETACIL